MKLLYFVDFDHQEAYGRSVTGATYRKLPHGPYPDKIEKLIKKMEMAGLVREDESGSQRLYPTPGCSPSAPSLIQRSFPGRNSKLWSVLPRPGPTPPRRKSKRPPAAKPRAGTADGKTIDYEMAEYRRAIGIEPLDDLLGRSRKFAEYVASSDQRAPRNNYFRF